MLAAKAICNLRVLTMSSIVCQTNFRVFVLSWYLSLDLIAALSACR